MDWAPWDASLGFLVVVMPLRPWNRLQRCLNLGRGTIPAFFHLFKGAQVTMVTGISFRGGVCVDHRWYESLRVCSVLSSEYPEIDSLEDQENPFGGPKRAMPIHKQNCEQSIALRIMGSQNWWFGDPRALLYRFKPLYRRIQWFLGCCVFHRVHLTEASGLSWLSFFAGPSCLPPKPAKYCCLPVNNICARVHQLLVLGMVIPPFLLDTKMGRWTDDHLNIGSFFLTPAQKKHLKNNRGSEDEFFPKLGWCNLFLRR